MWSTQHRPCSTHVRAGHAKKPLQVASNQRPATAGHLRFPKDSSPRFSRIILVSDATVLNPESWHCRCGKQRRRRSGRRRNSAGVRSLRVGNMEIVGMIGVLQLLLGNEEYFQAVHAQAAAVNTDVREVAGCVRSRLNSVIQYGQSEVIC